MAFSEVDPATGQVLPRAGIDLVGKSFTSKEGGKIAVVETCSINPTTCVVMENEAGEQWGATADKVRQILHSQGSYHVKPATRGDRITYSYRTDGTKYRGIVSRTKRAPSGEMMALVVQSSADMRDDHAGHWINFREIDSIDE